MLPLTKEQEAALGLELAAKRQEHSDLDAAIHTLSATGLADQMHALTHLLGGGGDQGLDFFGGFGRALG